MKLLSDWRDVLKRAWSIRLIVLAGILSGLEVILPMVNDQFPRGLFAVVSLLVTAGAFIARIVAQKNLKDVD